MTTQASPKKPTSVSRMIVFTGIILFLWAGSVARAQVISSPVVDAALPSYPGARPPVAFQADGKLLISGDSFLLGGATQKGMARLNADWSLDTGFTIGSGADNGAISTIVVQPDQKILVGGSFTSFSGQAVNGLVRLLPDGKPDPTFTYDGPGRVNRITRLTMGDYLLVVDDSSSNIRWHSATGALVRLLPRPVEVITDPASPEPPGSDRIQNSQVTPIDVAELKDGTILGSFQIVDRASPSRNTYARAVFAYGPDGTQLSGWPVIRPAASFTATLGLGLDGQAMRIIPTPAGGFYLLCSGSVFITGGVTPSLSRYLSDGSPDPGFVAPPVVARGSTVLTGEFDSTGNLIVSGGQFVDPDFPTDIWTTVRLLADGRIDSRFGIPSPGQFSSDMILGAVRKGPTPADDRVIMYAQTALVAFKPTNSLSLGGASALPATQTVTTGKNVSLTATAAGTDIQWQISTNGGQSWTNLTDGSTYHGTNTPTLDIIEASPAIANALFRYVSTTSRGSVSSNATTLNVAPAFFPFPAAIGCDAGGNLFVGDTSLHTIQKIDPSGKVRLVAGASGQTGTADGTGSSALFNQPGGLTAAANGELMICDTANGTVRRITADGIVSTFAGSSTTRGSADGPGTQALFSAPAGIARDAAGSFYVTDSSNHTIRKVTADGTVSTIAGAPGISGASDGTGTAARFNFPTGIAVDAGGNVYVADTHNNLIRRITPAGMVTTVAGVPAISGFQDGDGSTTLFNLPGGLGFDAAGNLYVADTGNSVIRRISPAGHVTTLAGLPTVGGHKDGARLDALLNQPKALAVAANGDIYVTDTGNSAIRRVTSEGIVATLDLSMGAPTIVTQPRSLTVAAGGSASFAVVADGAGTLAYQWQKDGTAITGATTPTYLISSANSISAGNYSVVVSNAGGSVTSAVATLTVNASTTPSTPPAAPGGKSGGGGAPSPWFAAALLVLAITRQFISMQKTGT